MKKVCFGLWTYINALLSYFINAMFSASTIMPVERVSACCSFVAGEL